jgi:O-antigen/teichoic acid export membrane protein
MDINIFSKRMAKGAVIVFFGMLLSKALAYFYVALLARLGSSEYGLLSLAISIVSFVSIFSLLGLNTGIIRYISYYKGKEDIKRIKGTILSSLKLSLPTSLILMILLFLFSEKISILIFHSSELIPVLRLFSLTLPFISLSDIFLGVMIGFQKINYKILVKEIVESVVRLVLTFIVIYLGYNLLGVAIVYVISFVITAFFSFYFLQKKVFPFFKTKVVPILFTKELFVFSFPFILSGVLTLIVKWTDVFMIGFFRTTSEVGVYNVALPTANLLVIVPTSLMALFMPIITEFYSKGNIKSIDILSRINSKWIFFLNFPIFLLIFLFSKIILKIMFGPEYVTGNIALLILIIGYMVFSLVHVHNAILIMMKKTRLIFYISLISAVANVILNYYLIPKFGIIGGSIATSFSLILIFTLTFISCYKLTNIQPLRLNYFKSILSGVISLLLVYFLIHFIGNISFILFILLSIVFLIVYSLLVYLLKGLDKEDIEIIKSFYIKFKKSF